MHGELWRTLMVCWTQMVRGSRLLVLAEQSSWASPSTAYILRAAVGLEGLRVVVVMVACHLC
jgi:hypothetical protein